MVGRYHKEYNEIKRNITIKLSNGSIYDFGQTIIMCPVCQSTKVSTNGTRKRKDERCEAFQCKNPDCDFLQNHKYGKQFVLSTSYLVQQQIMELLNKLYKDLVGNGDKANSIAREYDMSEALVSHLRKDLEDAINSHQGLDHLVEVPQDERAIAIDETFLKILGKPIYIIIATGYNTKKILGMKVSKTRNEKDMRDVFNEAQRNSIHRITTATADAWGATQTMAKNLMEDFTLIIHKHKKPYDTAVIRHFQYTSNERIITDIGVQVDIFKYRKTRKFYYLQRSESLQAPAAKPRGRPKGRKNGQKKAKLKSNNQRGRKRINNIFTTGKQGIVNVNPYRGTLKFGKKMLGAVAAALNKTIHLFAKQTIQNNLAENINSVLQSLIRLRGPKSIKSAANSLRTMVIVRNNPVILDKIRAKHKLRMSFLLKKVINIPCIVSMIQKGWYINGVKKIA